MPYTNIHWIKLEKRLLNDYRFYSMSEEAQLIYMKFFMLAAETNNKIPKNDGLIKSSLRSKQTETKIQECIEEIKTNFPKFKENRGFYYFKEWGTRCNWITQKELQRNSEGTPKDSVEENRIDKKRIDNILYTFLEKKGLKEQALKNKDFLSYMFKRNWRPIKQLLILAQGNDKNVIEAMDWFSGICDKKGFSWTLETILKWYPEFLSKGKTNQLHESIQKALEEVRHGTPAGKSL